MKLTTVVVLLASLQVAARGFSQKVTLNVEEVPLQKVFNQVKKQTGYLFLCDTRLLQRAQPVSIHVSQASLQEVMDACLQNQQLTYKIVGTTIVLTEKTVARVTAEQAAPPPVPVKTEGLVKDDKTGNPLAGASVTLKGTKKAVFTDANGKFTLEAAAGALLVVTYVGYEPKEITVAANTRGVVEVRLATTTQSLNDVVLNGIYARPAQNFTGAASSFTTEQINRVSNTGLIAAISVLDPSFQLPENISVGSNPNALPDVQIRGGNSIANPGLGTSSNDVFGYSTNKVNTPLFILDGFEVPLQRISDLDVNRVAKVSILKDASATAIYGSRAANGVVIIETIAPKDGRLRMSYNGAVNVEAPDLRDYDLLNAAEKLDLELKGGVYKSSINSSQENLNVLYNARLAQVKRGVNTYWLSQPLRTAWGSKHNILLEGGAGGVLYGIGLTYDKRAGVMKQSGRDNIMANSYLSYRVNRLLFKNDVTLTFNTANNSPYGNFSTYAAMNPYWSPYDANGKLVYEVEKLYQENGQLVYGTANNSYGIFINPLFNATINVVDRQKYQNITDNFSIQYQATNWLRLNGRFSMQLQKNQSDVFLPATHTSFAALAAADYDRKGSYAKAEGQRNYYEGYLTGDVNKVFNQHLIFATAGFNFSNTSENIYAIQATGFPNQRLSEIYNAVRYARDSKPSGYESKSRLAGYLANLSYSYDNRYLLDLSYRLDGSSLFGSNNRFANFWSAGAGWNLHKERLLAHVRGLDRLKLRYSFGYTGSQNFPTYLGNTTAQYYTDRTYNNSIGVYLRGWGNPDLAWQQTRKQNIGADVTLFNRLTVTANYFVEKTQGALATINTAPSTGFTSYNANLGDLQNKGWELYTNLTLYAKKRGMVSVFANIFSSKGKYTRISNSLDALNRTADTSKSTKPLVRYAEGQSPTAIWAVRSLGIDPGNGREIFLNREGKTTNVYSNLDQQITGDSRADVEGTFGGNAEIKGIGMNVYFRYRIGGQVYNQTLADRVENANILYNVDRRVYTQRWQKPGDHTFFKGIVTPDGYSISEGPTLPTSRFVQNYNFLTCESLSVYYRFSDKLNKRLHVSNTRITAYTGQLFRLSSVKQERGLDYPFSQTFTLLLQTTF
ncbi:TonB-linked SusC/RagA family outer membrane protein [Filimonas zeae]|uniref:SusC/RagA family TonB-linked outer membrane protein n=1 Tax=Filimonas zeae TaxID=1737353 RepID=A0A917MZ94_9BACT|nr:SusC/RagA family TonB-linked outer membrane protein [Filimonas zeae]MDR6339589.1 TonB-linked SusC/RagA family outer membrane protein [Filimonas zeae]GGH74326.1 SusC/RagA family TonB-linked outer membrane protein [Filimonas zeae]